MTRRAVRWLLVGAAAGLGLAVLALALGKGWVVGGNARRTGSTPAAGESFFVQDGLRVSLELEPIRARVEGRVPGDHDGTAPVREREDVRIRFAVREDAENGNPIVGLAPLAWLYRREEGEGLPDRETCKREIRALLAGRLARTAEVNLNEYELITLDDNNSISIIDPQIESSKTKTLGMVSLAGKGEDFVLAPDRRTVLVTLPGAGKVAACDIVRHIARYVEVGGSPDRISLQPDARLAWVGDRAAQTVHAVDVGRRALAASVTAMPGPHAFAFRDDSRLAYVASSRSPDIAVVDTVEGRTIASVETGAPVVALDYSALARRLFAALTDGRVAVVDADRREITGCVFLAPGLSDLRVSPDGRWVFVLDAERDRLVLVDAATGRAAFEIATERRPVRVDFTEAFAYVQHAGSEELVLVDLAALGQGGDPIASRVVLGQRPPFDPGPGASGRAHPALLALLPEGGGALILHPADRAIYHFMEGMNAPMGAYPTYPWPARGLLLADRTLRETERGVYATDFRTPGPGTYTVAFVTPVSPTLHGCMTVEIAGSPRNRTLREPLAVQPLFGDGEGDGGGVGRRLAVRQRVPVRLRVTDPADGTPLDGIEDLVLLLLRGPVWSMRAAARGLGDGRYEIDATFPDPGTYTLLVQSRSRGVRFGQIPGVAVRVGPDDGREGRRGSAGSGGTLEERSER